MSLNVVKCIIELTVELVLGFERVIGGCHFDKTKKNKLNSKKLKLSLEICLEFLSTREKGFVNHFNDMAGKVGVKIFFRNL